MLYHCVRYIKYPADHLCSDFITAYIMSARKSFKNTKHTT